MKYLRYLSSTVDNPEQMPDPLQTQAQDNGVPLTVVSPVPVGWSSHISVALSENVPMPSGAYCLLLKSSGALSWCCTFASSSHWSVICIHFKPCTEMYFKELKDLNGKSES